MASAKNCKKDAIFNNLRTITQEGDLKTRQMTPLFSSAKYLNLRGERFETRILSRYIKETYTLRKGKNQVLHFLSS